MNIKLTLEEMGLLLEYAKEASITAEEYVERQLVDHLLYIRNGRAWQKRYEEQMKDMAARVEAARAHGIRR